MPKVIHVKKARKDNKVQGIKKGQEYWWWGVMSGGRGHKRYSLTKPKPSQLTNSEFWGAVYGIQEDAEANPPDFENLESQRDDIVSQLEEIRDETQGKFDNMPDGLQQGDTGQLLEERVSSLEDAISEIESLDLDFDEEDVTWDKDEDKDVAIEAAKDAFTQEKWTEVTDALGNISCS